MGWGGGGGWEEEREGELGLVCKINEKFKKVKMTKQNKESDQKKKNPLKSALCWPAVPGHGVTLECA